MKRILYTMIMLLCVVIASAQDSPTTAVCQDTHYDCAVYIDEERPSVNEGEVPGIYNVWWKNLTTSRWMPSRRFVSSPVCSVGWG